MLFVSWIPLALFHQKQNHVDECITNHCYSFFIPDMVPYSRSIQLTVSCTNIVSHVSIHLAHVVKDQRSHGTANPTTSLPCLVIGTLEYCGMNTRLNFPLALPVLLWKSWSDMNTMDPADTQTGVASCSFSGSPISRVPLCCFYHVSRHS